ncbi:MAG: hypothetical protein LBR45_01055 [Bacteroidales bacterium]|jgi:hypothetical protein|nr:hypothetical protein [Bacteroidales bacterium]
MKAGIISFLFIICIVFVFQTASTLHSCGISAIYHNYNNTLRVEGGVYTMFNVESGSLNIGNSAGAKSYPIKN